MLSMKNWNAVADRRDMSVTVGFIVQAEYKLFFTVSSVSGRSVRWVGRLFQIEGAAWWKTRNWWKQSWQRSHACRRFLVNDRLMSLMWSENRASQQDIYRDTQIVSSWSIALKVRKAILKVICVATRGQCSLARTGVIWSLLDLCTGN